MLGHRVIFTRCPCPRVGAAFFMNRSEQQSPVPVSSTRTEPVRRWRTVAVSLLAISLSLGLPAAAQDDDSTIEDSTAKREQVRAEKAAAASDLDPLLTEDAELAQAVADLDQHVLTQAAKLDAIRQALQASQDEAAAAAVRVTEMEAAISQLKEAVLEQAVYAYTQPGGREVGTFLGSEDITEAVHKQALLDAVAAQEADALDLLRFAQDQLEVLSDEADAAVERVESEAAAEADQLGLLEEALADQERLRDALSVRIADVQAEIDALDAEEAQLSEFIRQATLAAEQQAAAEAAAAAQAQAQAAAAEASVGSAGPGSDENASVPPAPAPLPAPSTASGLVWPVGGPVSSFYGPRWGRMHRGIDIAAATGTPIVSVASGVVITAGSGGGYGNVVIVDHGDGFSTIYAHMTDIWATVGQSVGQGEAIGTVGCTGSCTGPHLHFETRVLGVDQDPMLYLG